mgnify:CR=1 FL=1
MSTTTKIPWKKYQTGDYYGYPRCCQDGFYEFLACKNKRSSDQRKAGNGTGFIPCVKHTEEILTGKLKLEDLILPTRQHPKPFPKN